MEQLLRDIYAASDRAEGDCLDLGGEAWTFGQAVEFPDHPTLRPRYLGHSQTRETFQKMEGRVPNPDFRPVNEPAAETIPDESMINLYEHIIEQIIAIGKSRVKEKKGSKKQDQQDQKKRMWKAELLLAERLLGLRPGSKSLKGM